MPRAGAVERDGHAFCCSGCSAAFAVIHGCGLDRCYALRDSATSPVRTSGRAYAEFDDPAFEALYVRTLAGDRPLKTTELMLQGLHCAACVWLVERVPSIVEGVAEARLDYRRATLRVTWDPLRVALSAIARALAALGYAPHPARGLSARELRRLDDRAWMARIGVAGACASNVMLLAAALYSGLLDAMDPSHARLLRWVSMGLSVLAMAWPGMVFLRGAWSAIRARRLSLDVPIAAGLWAGLAWGVVNTVRDTGEVYFDSIAVLVFALLVGRFIQQRQQRRALDSVELLFALTPSSARLVTERGVREAPVEALKVGDMVEVRPGDCVAVDGTIVQGATRIDAALLTGESRASVATLGQGVHAGTVNLDAPIRVRVEATGEATRVGKLMRLVEEGTRARAPIVQLTDRMAGWFIAAILVLGVATIALWWPIDPARGVERAVALLVVTCPCGLGLATPLVMTMALGRAARAGMLIKSAEAIERLAKPGAIHLDKTGTVTFGRTRVVRWWGDPGVRALAVVLAESSGHHAARAIAQWGSEQKARAGATDVMEGSGAIGAPSVACVAERGGLGLEGLVGGSRVRMGSESFVRPRALRDACAACAEEGLTPVVIEVDGIASAVAGLGDEIRPDARGAVRDLRERGWRVAMLSGDCPSIVARVCEAIAIDDGRGGLTPERKVEAVRDALRDRGTLSNAGTGRGAGPVVMVGDGVNDAPALATADVGIAVRGGAEASMAAADVYLSRPGLAPVVELLDGSRRAMRAVRRTILTSVAYNIVAAALCLMGLINPLLAAIIMPMSSLTVLAMAMRSRTFDGGSRESRRERAGAGETAERVEQLGLTPQGG
jgi:Cu2+-exporting ATPase